MRRPPGGSPLVGRAPMIGRSSADGRAEACDRCAHARDPIGRCGGDQRQRRRGRRGQLHPGDPRADEPEHGLGHLLGRAGQAVDAEPARLPQVARGVVVATSDGEEDAERDLRGQRTSRGRSARPGACAPNSVMRARFEGAATGGRAVEGQLDPVAQRTDLANGARAADGDNDRRWRDSTVGPMVGTSIR